MSYEYRPLFLMHRVELKGFYIEQHKLHHPSVPNAPCGVERFTDYKYIIGKHLVPNAPCGVESRVCVKMFRFVFAVPNAPCGVERQLFYLDQSVKFYFQFLMHRVELKKSCQKMPNFCVL